MAEDLGAAEESFTTAEASFTEAETIYNESKTAFDADPENEDLKTTFTEHETAYNSATEARDTAKTALDELKANANKGYWPEDWKERYIGKQVDKDGKELDETAKNKLMKRLSRYASPRAAMDAMINAQNKIAAGGLVKIPGKDATKEELAKYREEIGVPEEAKGYDLTLSDGMVIGDEDKASIDGFLDIAHANNYSQQQVTEGLNWFYQDKENQIQAQFEADTKYHSDAEEELRQEWGPEYKQNVNILVNHLNTAFGEGNGAAIANARLEDGTRLGDHVGICRDLVAQARAANPMSALVPGSGTKQHDQMVDEIAVLEKKMETDEWATDEKGQARYLKLISLRDKIPEK